MLPCLKLPIAVEFFCCFFLFMVQEPGKCSVKHSSLPETHSTFYIHHLHGTDSLGRNHFQCLCLEWCSRRHVAVPGAAQGLDVAPSVCITCFGSSSTPGDLLHCSVEVMLQLLLAISIFRVVSQIIKDSFCVLWGGLKNNQKATAFLHTSFLLCCVQDTSALDIHSVSKVWVFTWGLVRIQGHVFCV